MQLGPTPFDLMQARKRMAFQGTTLTSDPVYYSFHLWLPHSPKAALEN